MNKNGFTNRTTYHKTPHALLYVELYIKKFLQLHTPNQGTFLYIISL